MTIQHILNQLVILKVPILNFWCWISFADCGGIFQVWNNKGGMLLICCVPETKNWWICVFHSWWCFVFSHFWKDLVLSVLGLVYKLPSENVTNLVYWQRNFVVWLIRVLGPSIHIKAVHFCKLLNSVICIFIVKLNT